MASASLNIDMSAGAFHEPILVTEFVAELFNGRDLSRPLSDDDCVKVKDALRGIRVETTHAGYRRIYKIAGLSDKPLSQTTLNDGNDVVEYFRDRYEIPLTYRSLPALQVGDDTRHTYLPMELCRIVGGQRYNETVLLKASCQHPCHGERSIKQDKDDEEPLAEEFGALSIEARALPPPMVSCCTPLL